MAMRRRAAATEAAPSTVTARLLVDQQVGGAPYRCGDAVELPIDLVSDGMDTAPDAVAYALESEGRTVIRHP